MAHGHTAPRRRRIGVVAADGIIEFQLAVLCEKHNRGGGELYSSRRPTGSRALRRRHVKFHVRQAVTFGFRDLALAHHGKCETGNVVFLELRFDVTVDSVRDCGVVGVVPRCSVPLKGLCCDRWWHILRGEIGGRLRDRDIIVVQPSAAATRSRAKVKRLV